MLVRPPEAGADGPAPRPLRPWCVASAGSQEPQTPIRVPGAHEVRSSPASDSFSQRSDPITLGHVKIVRTMRCERVNWIEQEAENRTSRRMGGRPNLVSGRSGRSAAVSTKAKINFSMSLLLVVL
ncbi:hypothetical protein GCM10009799_51470 [Nocardiopsis rhodophaea]|uniref:Uncharacterized protein n=2 Tax=Nocardiopsis rhodophaea TaxID=280238 RepID=A0ABP5F7A1_9ACTN